jgi:hypothetical protein
LVNKKTNTSMKSFIPSEKLGALRNQFHFLLPVIAAAAWLFILGLAACASTASQPSTPPPPLPEVKISLNETLPISTSKDERATFITFYGEEDYRKAYLSELRRVLTDNRIIIDPTAPQFTVSFTSLKLNERTVADTVKDTRSTDNGKVFDVTIATLEASGSLLNVANQSSSIWIAPYDKKEKVTSWRSVGQMIKGENKSMDEYREKQFDRNEFVQLSGSCGARTAYLLAKKIREQLK